MMNLCGILKLEKISEREFKAKDHKVYEESVILSINETYIYENAFGPFYSSLDNAKIALKNYIKKNIH